jgi:hypothetical protein
MSGEATKEPMKAGSPDSCGSTSAESYYRRLHKDCFAVLEATFASSVSSLQSASHSFIKDMERWSEALGRRPEGEMLKAAMSEYQFALLSLVQGQYRQAFMSLRLTMELLLGGVYFSGNELELRIWLKGSRDLIWGAIVEDDGGVFSKKFIGAFLEVLADEGRHYRLIAESVYRECSEYVHGNAATHSQVPGTICFSQEMFESWHEKAKSVRLVTSFALCCRYVLFLDIQTRNSLEAVLLDNLGHLDEVRAILGAPVEPRTDG